MYQQHASILLDTGHAYRCFCPAERLNTLAKERHGSGLPSDYNRTCAGLSREESDDRAFQGQSHVVRLKVPDVPLEYTDLVYGVVGRRRKREKPPAHKHKVHQSSEDPILIKSDGFPTYHLANVVDDHHMGITHVIRAAVRTCNATTMKGSN